MGAEPEQAETATVNERPRPDVRRDVNEDLTDVDPGTGDRFDASQ